MESRRCQYCFGSQTLVAEWAYLPAGRTRLTTMVLEVWCKWCQGPGQSPYPRARRPAPDTPPG